jgi:transcriptional regulator with XRE-family HTH domain
MGRRSITALPSVRARLAELGGNIRLARLRRRLPARLVAERAGLARETLARIERGSPNVSAGHYAAVLFVLGLDQDIALVARDDELGRKLQDARLEPGARR